MSLFCAKTRMKRYYKPCNIFSDCIPLWGNLLKPYYFVFESACHRHADMYLLDTPHTFKGVAPIWSRPRRNLGCSHLVATPQKSGLLPFGCDPFICGVIESLPL